MLEKIEIQNFTCFPQATLNFSKGLNVIVGENGTGKSHILKLGYAVLRSLRRDASFVKEVYARDFATQLLEIFRPDVLGRLPLRAHGHRSCTIEAAWMKKGKLGLNFSPRNTELVNIDYFESPAYILLPLFVPPKEILSVFPGFQHALENRELSFDATYLDLAKALGASPLKGPRLERIGRYLTLLEEMIGGQVNLENGKFYFHSHSKNSINKKLEAQLMPEGHRKLGMIMHLLRTGGLTKRSTLFWDEPEANLNPKLIRKLAGILVHLSSFMQIVVATHSLFLLREFEIFAEQERNNNIRYFGLHFDGPHVCVIQGDSPHKIGNITSLDETIGQSSRYLNAGE